jgi:hypothetical protein
MLPNSEPTFDAPIPGMSLVHELGARPWQTPAQYTTVDEAIEYYMSRMTSEDFMLQVVDVLEMGVPVTVVVNTIQLANVMEGIHSIDVGMLVSPLLMELIMMIGDSAGIEYRTGMDDPDEGKTKPTFYAKYLNEYTKKLQETPLDELVEEEREKEEEIKEEPAGLMARRK